MKALNVGKEPGGGKRPEGIASFLSCQSNSLSRHTDGPGVLPKAHHPLFAPVTMVTWEQQPPSEHRWPFSVKVTAAGDRPHNCAPPHMKSGRNRVHVAFGITWFHLFFLFLMINSSFKRRGWRFTLFPQ